MNTIMTCTFWVADFEEADLAMLTALLDARAHNWYTCMDGKYITANMSEHNYVFISEKIQLQKV